MDGFVTMDLSHLEVDQLRERLQEMSDKLQERFVEVYHCADGGCDGHNVRGGHCFP